METFGDKDVVLIIGNPHEGTSIHMARLLMGKNVAVVSATPESLMTTIEQNPNKMIVIDDVNEFINSKPEGKSFVLTALCRDEPVITKKDVENYHPFSKFMNKGKKKW